MRSFNGNGRGAYLYLYLFSFVGLQVCGEHLRGKNKDMFGKVYAGVCNMNHPNVEKVSNEFESSIITIPSL